MHFVKTHRSVSPADGRSFKQNKLSAASALALSALSLAAALAAAPQCAAAYDADNPFKEFTVNGSDITAGENYPMYVGVPTHFLEDLLPEYLGFTSEETQTFIEAYNVNHEGPDGINVTVNGAVNISGTETDDTYLEATGNMTLNGSEEYGVTTALTADGGHNRVIGKDTVVNGAVNNGSDLEIEGASSVTINGDIRNYENNLEISSAGSIVINGNIRLSGDSNSGDTVYTRYYLSGYDEDAAYDEAVASFKSFRIRRAELKTEEEQNFHVRAMTYAHNETPGSVIQIGDEPAWDGVAEASLEGMEPTAPDYIKINGNISVENSYNTANSVHIALTGDGSGWTWKGSAEMTGSGCTNCALMGKGIYIYAHEGAVWQVEGADSTSYSNYSKVSSISRWTSYGNSVIDLTKTSDTLLLRIDELTGSGTVIREKVDPNHVAGVNGTDMVVLGGRSTGEHRVELYSTGAEPMEITTGRIPYLQVTVPCPVSQRLYHREAQGEADPWLILIGYNEDIAPALKLSTEENAAGDGKLAHIQIDGTRYYTYNETGNNGENTIVLQRDFPSLTINYGNLNNELDVGLRKYKILDPVVQPDGSVIFYIEMEGHLNEDGTPAPASALTFNELSTGAEIVTTLAGEGSMYSAWMADLSDLRKRLGEVRYGAQDGLWAKGIAQRDRIEGITGADFKQKLYGLQFGLDHIVTQDEDRMWLVGGNFKYNTVDQKVDAMRYGHGDMKSYGAFLYATYADYKGYYTDLVLSLDRYKQKMTAEQTDSSYVHGRYNTWGWGASVEVGKMFSSTQSDEGWGPWYNNWWIEPQAQLAYYWINGKKFSLDNDMNVRQKNGDSLIGRLGVVIGKKFNYGANRKEVDKRYSQFYVKGGVKHEFLGKQTLYVNNEAFNDKLRGTRVYYGAGFDWNFTDQMKLYAQVERESGHKYKKDYEVSVGLKWQF